MPQENFGKVPIKTRKDGKAKYNLITIDVRPLLDKGKPTVKWGLRRTAIYEHARRFGRCFDRGYISIGNLGSFKKKKANGPENKKENQ